MKWKIIEFAFFAACSTTMFAQTLSDLRVGMSQDAVQSALASCCTTKPNGVSGELTVYDKQGKTILAWIDFNSANILRSVQRASEDVTSLNSLQLISLLAEKLSANCREVIPNNGSSLVATRSTVTYPTPPDQIAGGIILQCGKVLNGTVNGASYMLGIQSIPTDTSPGGRTGEALLSETWFLP